MGLPWALHASFGLPAVYSCAIRGRAVPRAEDAPNRYQRGSTSRDLVYLSKHRTRVISSPYQSSMARKTVERLTTAASIAGSTAVPPVRAQNLANRTVLCGTWTCGGRRSEKTWPERQVPLADLADLDADDNELGEVLLTTSCLSPPDQH